MSCKHLLVCVMAAALASACASAPKSSGFGDEPAAAPDYVIGPGDSVQIFVWRNPELTATVPVRPDGKISTPLVEDMTAVGKSPSQLARDIEAVLSRYVKSPQVNVIVTQPVSAFSQVRVVGQVKRPSALPYREGMTLLDAVLAVDGLAEFAAPKRAHLIRNVNGKRTAIKVNLEAILDGADMSDDLPLRPGDVLVVPESRF